ncbi:DHS-like NAD/FAD-binding domain-containing protein [Cladochytrium replicatum]|nr:DHS-like NAD/FAD-binding domain-containing protein [Cladochytrium replicatum]
MSAARLRYVLETYVEQKRVAVLCGAGISTDSNIPCYRGHRGVGDLKNYTSITYQAFVGSAAFRSRYWARSFVGYPFISRAAPNASHYALHKLQASGVLGSIVTQNVDGLHHKAARTSGKIVGPSDVIELHGSLDGVRCLCCSWHINRHDMQGWLRDLNPEWAEWSDRRVARARAKQYSNVGSSDRWEHDSVVFTLGAAKQPEEEPLRPDGDVDIDGLLKSGEVPPFHVPECPICAEPTTSSKSVDLDTMFQEEAGRVSHTARSSTIKVSWSSFSRKPSEADLTGVLKPTVLFFGEGMDPRLAEASFDAVDNSEALLVVGSSLTVYSAFRLARRAVEQGREVFVLNKGETRLDQTDGLSNKYHKIDEWCGDVLPGIAEGISSRPNTR